MPQHSGDLHVGNDSPTDVERRSFVMGMVGGALALSVPGCAHVASEQSSNLVNDVTRLNPVRVDALRRPTSTRQICDILRTWNGTVSVGGARHSMGGQIAEPGSLHLDMRAMNQVVTVVPREQIIRVQAGATWRDVQDAIDPFDLSVKIMQSFANFSVGGSLSVNAHGRYVGAGPVINSVRAIQVVSASGEVIEATRDSNSDWFRGVIGGYAGLGVISEVELDLVPNTCIERDIHSLPVDRYRDYFEQHVRNQSDVVLHNADLVPPHFEHATAISWRRTQAPVTVNQRLVARAERHLLEEGAIWAISHLPGGNRLRESVVDPLRYHGKEVVWRNFEASQDVASLGTLAHRTGTFALQEYFVPTENFDAFVGRMSGILDSHDVQALNVSVRHSPEDSESLMAWARKEVFSFVLYYYQSSSLAAQRSVGLWTRELIQAALTFGGTYYLPYQLHATQEQFHRAYPAATRFFALKRALDPGNRFRNQLWDKYTS